MVSSINLMPANRLTCSEYSHLIGLLPNIAEVPWSLTLGSNILSPLQLTYLLFQFAGPLNCGLPTAKIITTLIVISPDHVNRWLPAVTSLSSPLYLLLMLRTASCVLRLLLASLLLCFLLTCFCCVYYFNNLLTYYTIMLHYILLTNLVFFSSVTY